MNRTAAYVAVIAALSLAGQALAMGGSMGGRMSMGTMSTQTGHQQVGGTGMGLGAGENGSSMHGDTTGSGSTAGMDGGMAAATGATMHGAMAGTASSPDVESTVTVTVPQSQMEGMPHESASNN